MTKLEIERTVRPPFKARYGNFIGGEQYLASYSDHHRCRARARRDVLARQRDRAEVPHALSSLYGC
jgi:hypothetical protein